jgi:hypothetical protein
MYFVIKKISREFLFLLKESKKIYDFFYLQTAREKIRMNFIPCIYT